MKGNVVSMRNSVHARLFSIRTFHIAIVLLCACGQAPVASPPHARPTKPAPTGPQPQVVIAPNSLLLGVGTTGPLVATLVLEGDPPTSGPFDWTSSEPAIATVDDAGVVSAAAPGFTTITAEIGAQRGSASIEVARHLWMLDVRCDGLIGSVARATGALLCFHDDDSLMAEQPIALRDGETIQLVANTSPPGTVFLGWTDDCASSGNAPTCTLLATRDLRTTARFETRDPLVIRIAGSGAVAGDIPGTSCDGGTCNLYLLRHASARLQAIPAPGWIFGSWDGSTKQQMDPAPQPACTDPDAGDLCDIGGCCGPRVFSIVANFVRAVGVTLDVSDGGQVQSDPAGLQCDAGSCTAAFAVNTALRLIATADPGNAIATWGGACSGFDPVCGITLQADAQASLQFAPASALLVSVTGRGSVVSDTGRLQSCGGICSAAIPQGDRIALTALPASGGRFLGWSDDCDGGGACTIGMDRDRVVRAVFTP